MADPMDPSRFLGKPDEYLAWAKKNSKFNPVFCSRHWMPCPVEGKNGMLVTVILQIEMLGMMPADLVKPGVEPSSAMNSWMANQIIPLCCKLGDEKMNWLWWIIDISQERLCNQKYPLPGSVRVCWRLKNHDGDHEWQKLLDKIGYSTFDLMDEVNPRTVK